MVNAAVRSFLLFFIMCFCPGRAKAHNEEHIHSEEPERTQARRTVEIGKRASSSESKGYGMATLSLVLVGLVALEHMYILVLEMFLWTTPRARRIFGTTPEIARDSQVLAANQGLYNGFLAAGLIWGMLHPDPRIGTQIQIFFLLCVLVAGIYGGLTAKRSILLVQGGPALLALLAVLAR
jgi:putative membrane protein